MKKGRKAKKEILSLLAGNDLHYIMNEVDKYHTEDIISPLFTGICNLDQNVKWHAVSYFGKLVKRINSENVEKSRIIMRRFLWSLNDESGGIGWGAPEAMGEIMYSNDIMRKEYFHMLFSYTQPDGDLAHQDGNYLELPFLQRGLMWGLVRLSGNYSEIFPVALLLPALRIYLQEDDFEIRSLVLLLIRRLGITEEIQDAVCVLPDSEKTVKFYEDGDFHVLSYRKLKEDVLL